MNWQARLAKVERQLGKDNCPACRLWVRWSWVDPVKRPKPAPLDPDLDVYIPCELCGRERHFTMATELPEVRPLIRLAFQSPMEQLYTDPRAWAAHRWAGYHYRLRAEGGEIARPPTPKGGPVAQPDADVKFYRKLKAAAEERNEQKRQRLQALHGQEPFPELKARIDAIKQPDYSAEGKPYRYEVSFVAAQDLAQRARLWLICMELERFLLGEPLPSSEAGLAEIERRVSELHATGQQRYEEKQAAEAAKQKQRAATMRPDPEEQPPAHWLEEYTPPTTAAPTAPRRPLVPIVPPQIPPETAAEPNPLVHDPTRGMRLMG